VARYPFAADVGRLEVLPWGDLAALRTQSFFEGEPLIATYRVLSRDLVASPFRRGRAAPVSGRRASPSGSPTCRCSPPERPTRSGRRPDARGQARLAEAAEALDLTPQQVRPYIFYEPGRGAPFLIIAERSTPSAVPAGAIRPSGTPARRGWLRLARR
jgi:hypothetical protein